MEDARFNQIMDAINTLRGEVAAVKRDREGHRIENQTTRRRGSPSPQWRGTNGSFGYQDTGNTPTVQRNLVRLASSDVTHTNTRWPSFQPPRDTSRDAHFPPMQRRNNSYRRTDNSTNRETQVPQRDNPPKEGTRRPPLITPQPLQDVTFPESFYRGRLFQNRFGNSNTSLTNNSYANVVNNPRPQQRPLRDSSSSRGRTRGRPNQVYRNRGTSYVNTRRRSPPLPGSPSAQAPEIPPRPHRFNNNNNNNNYRNRYVQQHNNPLPPTGEAPPRNRTNRNSPNPRRNSHPNNPPTPTTAAAKLLTQLFQINHALLNWRSNPLSISKKMDDIFDNITPPLSDGIFRNEMTTLCSETLGKLNDAVTHHLRGHKEVILNKFINLDARFFGDAESRAIESNRSRQNKISNATIKNSIREAKGKITPPGGDTIPAPIRNPNYDTQANNTRNATPPPSGDHNYARGSNPRRQQGAKPNNATQAPTNTLNQANPNTNTTDTLPPNNSTSTTSPTITQVPMEIQQGPQAPTETTNQNPLQISKPIVPKPNTNENDQETPAKKMRYNVQTNNKFASLENIDPEDDDLIITEVQLGPGKMNKSSDKKRKTRPTRVLTTANQEIACSGVVPLPPLDKNDLDLIDEIIAKDTGNIKEQVTTLTSCSNTVNSNKITQDLNMEVIIDPKPQPKPCPDPSPNPSPKAPTPITETLPPTAALSPPKDTDNIEIIPGTPTFKVPSGTPTPVPEIFHTAPTNNPPSTPPYDIYNDPDVEFSPDRSEMERPQEIGSAPSSALGSNRVIIRNPRLPGFNWRLRPLLPSTKKLIITDSNGRLFWAPEDTEVQVYPGAHVHHINLLLLNLTTEQLNQLSAVVVTGGINNRNNVGIAKNDFEKTRDIFKSWENKFETRGYVYGIPICDQLPQTIQNNIFKINSHNDFIFNKDYITPLNSAFVYASDKDKTNIHYSQITANKISHDIHNFLDVGQPKCSARKRLSLSSAKNYPSHP